MDIFIIIVLVVAAVILFLVELFIVPGISIAGFLAGGCIIYANYYAFTNMEQQQDSSHLPYLP